MRGVGRGRRDNEGVGEGETARGGEVIMLELFSIGQTHFPPTHCALQW